MGAVSGRGPYRVSVGGFWLRVAPDPILPPQVAGSGGPVGHHDRRRSASAYRGEWGEIRVRAGPAGPGHLPAAGRRRLRPGGAQPVAELTWRHGRGWRHAYLYDVQAAKPQRPMTAAKRAALAKAMRANRTCPACGRDAGYVIPTSLGACVDCHDGPATSPSPSPATAKTANAA